MEVTQRIPTGLTSGVERELSAAVQRTGWTPELERAARVLPTILALPPAEFEARFAELYRTHPKM